MKKCFTILLLVFLNQFINAQVLGVFPQDSAYWELNFTCYDGGPNPYSVTEYIEVLGDTLVNEEEYIVLDGMISVLVKVEDNKVYFKDYWEFPDTSDVLLYDFNLEVGDVFYYPDFLYMDSVIISEVDTVQYLDGIDRKRIVLEQPYSNICGEVNYWVEGIGSIVIPFYFLDCFECMLNGFKFYQNEALVFDNVVISTKEPIDSDVQLFPNPANESFIVESKSDPIQDLRLMDFRGKVISEKSVFDNRTEVQIPIDLPVGIYWVRMEFDKNRSLIKKLILE